VEVTIGVPQEIERVALFGPAERNLKMIRESLGVSITARDRVLRVRGDVGSVDAARRVIERLIERAERSAVMTRMEVLNIIAEAGTEAVRSGRRLGEEDYAPEGDDLVPWTEALDVYAGGRQVSPRSPNQEAYLEAIRTHDLVFTTGPAGTGKTYLAVAAAIHLLKSGRVKKAILARPAVEAGEKLGFLPGDQFAKVNPYLRPLLDALHDMMDYATIKRFMAADVIEIVPLAFMRGRTLNDAVIILDEAQNTTRGQMHMFLTRMGQRSKMIVTGDTTQIDIEDPRESGLIDAIRRLRRTRGVEMVTLDRSDVVRHELVQRIIDAYENARDTRPVEEPERAEPATEGRDA
jgi:phosphate starvation-inducible PhoH-like protein